MMSMLNQAAVEALCSATYLESYLDCMESLPIDLQRIVTHLRELDAHTNELLSDIRQHHLVYTRGGDGVHRKRALLQIQRGLIRSQEIGDEKLQLVSQVMEHIENRSRQLDQNLENLDPGTVPASQRSDADDHHHHKVSLSASAKSAAPAVRSDDKAADLGKSKRQRRQRLPGAEIICRDEDNKKEEDDRPKKKKKRKAGSHKKGGDSSSSAAVPVPASPDEPTYCLCRQVSYGDMIGCDNDACAIEWFHFNCVGLSNKPKGRWYCPKCRGDRPNVRRANVK